VYIDDGRGLAKSKEQADADYALVQCVFSSAGFSISEEKSDALGDSSQIKEYLGFVINSKTMEVFVPELKLKRVLASLDLFLLSSWHSVESVRA
jgi:hypothetical protein